LLFLGSGEKQPRYAGWARPWWHGTERTLGKNKKEWLCDQIKGQSIKGETFSFCFNRCEYSYRWWVVEDIRDTCMARGWSNPDFRASFISLNCWSLLLCHPRRACRGTSAYSASPVVGRSKQLI
jgi:hypothetical protein